MTDAGFPGLIGWCDAYDVMHPLSENGTGHEIMGVYVDGRQVFLTTDMIRSLFGEILFLQQALGEATLAATTAIAEKHELQEINRAGEPAPVSEEALGRCTLGPSALNESNGGAQGQSPPLLGAGTVPEPECSCPEGGRDPFCKLASYLNRQSREL